jgi:hypothetical protein
MDKRKWISRADAAKKLGLSSSRVYMLSRKLCWPRQIVGRTLYYPRQCISSLPQSKTRKKMRLDPDRNYYAPEISRELTAAELLPLLATGKKYHEIAGLLGTAEYRVAQRVSELLHQTGAIDRWALEAMYRCQMVSAPALDSVSP